MRRLEALISDGRIESDNSDYGTDRGIQQNTFVQWANAAQDKLEAMLVALHCPLLVVSKEIDSVARQEAYAFPDDMYQNTAYDLIEFSQDGNVDNYYPLDQKTRRERVAGAYSNPEIYFVKGRYFLASPIPTTSSGKFKVDYYKALPKLDLRRGLVSAVTLNTSAKTITSLTLDTTTQWSETDADLIEELGYLCVVNKDGVQQMRRIPVTSISRTTGVVTIPTFAYQTGETIAVGDYIVSGFDAVTHSQLPENTERYLIAYMAWKGLKKDSSKDARETLQDELKDMEATLSETFSESEQDVEGIPILEDDLLTFE